MLVLALTAAALLGAVPDYEAKLIAWGLAQHGRELEPAPEGKVVEEILVAGENVFTEGDVFPAEWNKVHWTTLEHVVRREVLLRPGDVWSRDRIIESERIMRALTLFSIARIVPVKGRAGGIGLLVVTQDRWSLRLNSQFNLVGDLLQYLRLQPSEWNVFGFGKVASIDVVLELGSLTVSQGYVDPRLFGTHFRLAETAGVVFNRRSLAPEGLVASLQLARPLVTLAEQWAFSTATTFTLRPVRVFRGPDVWQLDSPFGPVPYVYDSGAGDGEVTVTRRFGEAYKVSLQAGLRGYGRRYSPPAGLDDARARWLREGWMPPSESAGGPVVRFELFKNDFTVLSGIESYELSEDVQLGPRLYAALFWATPLPVFSVSYVEAALSARWRWALGGGGLLTVQGAAFARFIAGGLPLNRRYALEVVGISPRLGGGRLVARVLGDVRQNDLTNTRVLLGGGNGVRGAPPELQAGRNLVLGNLEYRTATVAYQSVRFGGATFYDVGSAFDGAAVALTHTVGAGLRVLFPQFGPEVLRVDVGFIVAGRGFPGGMLSIGNVNGAYGQITDFRPAQFFDAPL